MIKAKINKNMMLSLLIIITLLLSTCTLSIGTKTVNLPPPVPTVTGPTSGDVGTQYTFCAVATFGCSAVSYQFDWGGSTSSWYGTYSSGQQCCKPHSWDAPGTYSVKARSKAPCGHTSSWSASHSIVISGGAEGPELGCSPRSHSFGKMDEGQTSSTTFKIWNSGTETLTYSLSESCGWVDINPSSGSSTGERDTITVDIDTSGLSPGSHSCNIHISSNGGSGAFTTTVTITKDNDEKPILSYTPRSYNFGDMLESEDNSTTFEIWNFGTGTLTYILSESCDWVDVSPLNGFSTGGHNTITVNVNTTGLIPDHYTCNITISSNAGSGIFAVSLMVIEEPLYPDLDCSGSLAWTDVKPSDTVTDNFTIKNIGDSDSKLNWKIVDEPNWGTWTFTPKEGNNLTPEDGLITVQVSVVVPDENEQEFNGEVKIVNMDDDSDYELIQISLATPKNKSINTPLLNFLQQYPYIFPLLRHLLGL